MYNTNIVATYDYYTLDQAKAILMEEHKEKIEKRKRRKQRKLQILKQRVQGISLIVVGLLLMRLFYIIANDGAAGLFFILPGLSLVFCNKPIV